MCPGPGEGGGDLGISLWEKHDMHGYENLIDIAFHMSCKAFIAILFPSHV